jgi:hypothetical protein
VDFSASPRLCGDFWSFVSDFGGHAVAEGEAFFEALRIFADFVNRKTNKKRIDPFPSSSSVF